MKTLACAAGLLLLSGAAVAADGESSRKAGNGSGEMKLICKDEKIPGTIIGKRRICRTRDQWLDDKAQTRQVIDRAQVVGIKG